MGTRDAHKRKTWAHLLLAVSIVTAVSVGYTSSRPTLVGESSVENKLAATRHLVTRYRVRASMLDTPPSAICGRSEDHRPVCEVIEDDAIGYLSARVLPLKPK
ncbi:hypothetical protein F4604DRAFT_1813064 [Suillus subluteus]|nr:hypothetical protein F4604DRAFT_1813064 [Suillus subluteus]